MVTSIFPCGPPEIHADFARLSPVLAVEVIQSLAQPDPGKSIGSILMAFTKNIWQLHTAEMTSGDIDLLLMLLFKLLQIPSGIFDSAVLCCLAELFCTPHVLLDLFQGRLVRMFKRFYTETSSLSAALPFLSLNGTSRLHSVANWAAPRDAYVLSVCHDFVDFVSLQRLASCLYFPVKQSATSVDAALAPHYELLFHSMTAQDTHTKFPALVDGALAREAYHSSRSFEDPIQFPIPAAVSESVAANVVDAGMLSPQEFRVVAECFAECEAADDDAAGEVLLLALWVALVNADVDLAGLLERFPLRGKDPEEVLPPLRLGLLEALRLMYCPKTSVQHLRWLVAYYQHVPFRWPSRSLAPLDQTQLPNDEDSTASVTVPVRPAIRPSFFQGVPSAASDYATTIAVSTGAVDGQVKDKISALAQANRCDNELTVTEVEFARVAFDCLSRDGHGIYFDDFVVALAQRSEASQADGFLAYIDRVRDASIEFCTAAPRTSVTLTEFALMCDSWSNPQEDGITEDLSRPICVSWLALLRFLWPTVPPAYIDALCIDLEDSWQKFPLEEVASQLTVAAKLDVYGQAIGAVYRVHCRGQMPKFLANLAAPRISEIVFGAATSNAAGNIAPEQSVTCNDTAMAFQLWTPEVATSFAPFTISFPEEGGVRCVLTDSGAAASGQEQAMTSRAYHPPNLAPFMGPVNLPEGRKQPKLKQNLRSLLDGRFCKKDMLLPIKRIYETTLSRRLSKGASQLSDLVNALSTLDLDIDVLTGGAAGLVLCNSAYRLPHFCSVVKDVPCPPRPVFVHHGHVVVQTNVSRGSGASGRITLEGYNPGQPGSIASTVVFALATSSPLADEDPSPSNSPFALQKCMDFGTGISTSLFIDSDDLVCVRCDADSFYKLLLCASGEVMLHRKYMPLEDDPDGPERFSLSLTFSHSMSRNRADTDSSVCDSVQSDPPVDCAAENCVLPTSQLSLYCAAHCCSEVGCVDRSCGFVLPSGKIASSPRSPTASPVDAAHFCEAHLLQALQHSLDDLLSANPLAFDEETVDLSPEMHSLCVNAARLFEGVPPTFIVNISVCTSAVRRSPQLQSPRLRTSRSMRAVKAEAEAQRNELITKALAQAGAIGAVFSSHTGQTVKLFGSVAQSPFVQIIAELPSS